MVCHTGSARFALFLLCCMGTLLSSHTAPISGHDLTKIILELRFSSKGLLREYKESGLSDSTPYPLPSLTSYCQPPHIANSLAILPYFRAIKPLLDDEADIDVLIEQLNKLNIPHEPDTEVLVPENTFEHKRFIVAVLQRFSTCMDSVQS
ncbi:interleukin-31 [Pteropus medius]|uniref:interleukin-31 n=1 Tax=Pteropus vampyrus TaxID=132908 RepID=UPI00196B0C75|nr:interleukin-31 [Pteropus giganteus]